jgi:hypothetical protein
LLLAAERVAQRSVGGGSPRWQCRLKSEDKTKFLEKIKRSEKDFENERHKAIKTEDLWK